MDLLLRLLVILVFHLEIKTLILNFKKIGGPLMKDLKFEKPRTNVEEIADLAAVTKPYFIKIFKSEFGFSPIQYINKKKVERAQLLLYTTEQTVKEVAYALGFCDQNYFIRLFRKVTGITPQKYRKILRA